MPTAVLHGDLPLAEGAVPTRLHLVPSGTFRAVDGRGPFHLRDPQAVMAASPKRLPLDENHSTDLAGKMGLPSPARGWIDSLEYEAGTGIWGHVEWTPSGQALMADKAYRCISPVIDYDADGNVTALLRAALTNDPGLTQLATLHSRQDGTMNMTDLRAALGLPDTADEAACVQAAREARAAATASTAHFSLLATAAGAKASDPAGIVAAVQAALADKGGTAQMAAKVVELETQLATLARDGRMAAATAYVDGQIKAGKPIASLRDHFIARHAADPAAVQKELDAMPSINAGGLPPRREAQKEGEADLSADDTLAVTRMGLDAAKFAEQKKKEGRG